MPNIQLLEKLFRRHRFALQHWKAVCRWRKSRRLHRDIPEKCPGIHAVFCTLCKLQKDSYLLKTSCPRFGSGEAKGMIHESVRGADLFVMVDVCNYSLTYSVNGHLNHMSPDDHYQDLKRIIPQLPERHTASM